MGRNSLLRSKGFWFCCQQFKTVSTLYTNYNQNNSENNYIQITLKTGVGSLRHHLHFKNASEEKGLSRNENKKKGLN